MTKFEKTMNFVSKCGMKDLVVVLCVILSGERRGDAWPRLNFPELIHITLIPRAA